MLCKSCVWVCLANGEEDCWSARTAGTQLRVIAQVPPTHVRL